MAPSTSVPAPTAAAGVASCCVPASSPEDKRQYRRVVLGNGLTALLVHDPEVRPGFEGGEAWCHWPTTGGAPSLSCQRWRRPRTCAWKLRWRPRGALAAVSRRRARPTPLQRAAQASQGTLALLGTRAHSPRLPQTALSLTDGASLAGHWPLPQMASAPEDEGGEGGEDEGEGSEMSEDGDYEEGSDEGSEEGDYDDEGSEGGSEAAGGGGGGGGGGGSKGATKKAAAALAVSVGSFSDPACTQGLAHFLEHMLFMGSEAFPDENEYDAFLSRHGGGSNAFTECEHTCYFFDVHRGSLRGALERFAGFFVSPLVKAGSMEREVQAVESEFRQALNSDGNRLLQLQCHTASEGHPFNAFFWGNLKSLQQQPAAAGVDMRRQLLEFYDAHYCAPRMSLVVVGQESLDELQGWVAELFANVRRAPSEAAAFAPDFEARGVPFAPRVRYVMPAVRDVMQLHILWCLPPLLKAYRSKPAEFASHLLGHEGRGSLFSNLKARGWVTALSGGVGDGGHDRSTNSSMFVVTAHLTEEGLQRRDDIASLVFQYAAMLCREGPQKWVFDELRAVADVQFRYHEEEDADEYACRLACSMPLYAPEHTLSGDYVYEEWDPQGVAAVLERLTPANARIDLVAREDRLAKVIFPGAADKLPAGALPLKEPWFDVPYAAEPLPDALVERWEAEAGAGALRSETREEADKYPALAMPPRNEFLPTDFTLQPAPPVETAAHPEHGYVPAVAPRTVVDGPLCRLWHKGDAVFRTPRACAFLSLSAPGHHLEQRNLVLTELLGKLLADGLNETTYMASMADLDAHVRRSGERVEIKVSGFSHRLLGLLKTVLAKTAEAEVKDDRFEVMREELSRAYRNANMRPLGHASYLRLYCLRQATHDVEQVPALLEALTPADVRAFAAGEYRTDARVEALVTGNVSDEEVRALDGEIARLFTHAAGSEAPLRPAQRVTALREGCASLLRSLAKNPKEDNSALEVYWQLGADSPATRAALDLLEQAIGEPFFDQLRTKEQLGYSLDIGLRLTHGVLGFAARVQSAEHPPEYLSDCVGRFLAGYVKTLRDMSDADFEQYRAARISARLQKDPSLLDESERQWGEVWEGRYLFDVRERDAAAIAACTKQQVVELFERFIAPSAPKQRKLWCAVYSHRYSARMDSAGDAAAAAAATGGGVLEAEHVAVSSIAAWRQRNGWHDTPMAAGGKQ